MVQTVEITLPELLERVRVGQIPMSAKARVTYDDAALPANGQQAAPDAAPDDPTLKLFEQWDKEAEAMTPEELEAERRLFEQLENNMNETRRACGMRTL
jgi:hypothetical protein